MYQRFTEIGSIILLALKKYFPNISVYVCGGGGTFIVFVNKDISLFFSCRLCPIHLSVKHCRKK